TCGRRMNGVVSKGYVYYRCDPRINDRDHQDRYTGHPRTGNLSERPILDAVRDFYRDRAFGPRRRELLIADLDGLDDTAAEQRERDRQRHQRVLADITRRQNNLMRQAQDVEPGDSFASRLRESYQQLETDRLANLAAIAQLDGKNPGQSPKPAP